MKSQKLLEFLVANWTHEDCIAYLRTQKLDTLQSMCSELVVGEFDDCPTVADMQKIQAGFGFLGSPAEWMRIYTREQTYNGWSNRETWAVFVHIVNNEASQRHFRALMKEQAKRGEYEMEWALRENFTNLLNTLLSDDVDYWFGFEKGAVLDIGSLWRVDWLSVAKALAE